MQEIKNFANINEEGLDYALGKAKSVYTDTQKKTGSYELHKWSKKQRIAFVHSLVRSYLNHAHHAVMKRPYPGSCSSASEESALRALALAADMNVPVPKIPAYVND